jgi:hypothetical protein
VYKLADDSVGHRIPRPWDPDIAEKLKGEEGIRAIAEEMGDKNPKATAHQAWRQIQDGKTTRENVARRIAEFRAKKLQTMAASAQELLANQQQIERSIDHEMVVIVVLAGEGPTAEAIDRLAALIRK